MQCKNVDTHFVIEHGNTKSNVEYPFSVCKDYFVFGMVRNPWSRLFSWYRLHNQYAVFSLEKEQFTKTQNNKFFHFNQLDYFTDKEGILIAEAFYRFEEYHKSITQIKNKLHISEDFTLKINELATKNYKSFYTQESKEFIAEACKKDISYFNYVF